MELISPKLVLVKDMENLVSTAKNLCEIQNIKDSLSAVDDKNYEITNSNIQTYIALLGAYRRNDDFDEALAIAKIIYNKSIKSKEPSFQIQATYMLICSLFDAGLIYDGKVMLQRFEMLVNKNFMYLYYAAVAKYYGIKNENAKEIKYYKKSLNQAIRENLFDRILFEITSGIAIAYEKNHQYHRALYAYELLNSDRYKANKYLNKEQKISLIFRIERIKRYLKINDLKSTTVNKLLNESKSLNTQHPLRKMINTFSTTI